METTTSQSQSLKHKLWKTVRMRIPAIAGIILAFLTGDAIKPLAILLIIVSLYYIISGLVRKDLATPKLIVIYSGIVAVFIALGSAALTVGAPWSYYIVAGGWLLHAVWDVYHFRKNKVVPKWVSEFCFVYDTLIAITLVILAASGQF